MSDKHYVVTCVQGDNSDLFPDALHLYVHPPAILLDMTWGNGVFWKKVNMQDYTVFANDLDKERGDTHYDFRSLPVEWEGQFDGVVLDPPYLYTGGFKTLKSSIDRGYNNKKRSVEQGIYGVKAVDEMYFAGIREAFRVLKPKGILFLKCADQVMSGEQCWAHEVYGRYAVESVGFKKEDLFILMQKNMPAMRWPPEMQDHARRNHSYLLVFKRRK